MKESIITGDYICKEIVNLQNDIESLKRALTELSDFKPQALAVVVIKDKLNELTMRLETLCKKEYRF